MAAALHTRTHPSYVEGCFGCKAASVRTSADATPFRKAHTSIALAEDKRVERDGAAYRRLVKEGLQPPRVWSDGKLPGAAQIEANARTADEVMVGRPLPGDGKLLTDLPLV